MRPIHRLAVAVCIAIVCAVRADICAAELVDTIARIKLSVVMIGTYQPLGSPQFNLLGTGFVVGDGRTVATNAHVVGQIPPGEATTLVVVVAGASTSATEQQVRKSRVWKLDSVHDLALLKFDGPALPSLGLKDSDTVREGTSVAFAGFPLGNVIGFVPVTHRGMISAITPIALPSANSRQLSPTTIRRLNAGAFNIFQIDGTAYPGNSGGPMFDVESGDVVGVINMVFVKGSKEAALAHPSGISYAIPANFLRDLLNERP